MTRRIIIAAGAAAALAAPGAAQAHVTLQPKQAPADGYTRLDVRVPNEEDAAATTKVVVQMPPGFAGVSYEPVPGWRTAVATRKLAKPVKTADGELTEEVARLTFTATGKGLAPGQFQDFGLSLRLPDKPAGTKLTFKALQTYSGGTVVRWIGAPESDRPAPQVTLTPAVAAGRTGAAAPAAADQNDDGPDGGGNGLAIAALIVGALGLLAGGTALVRARA
jgi:uncharacterized protein YcnI